MAKKVIARVFGGLGNQLFIYATAKAVSLRCHSDLVLDVNSGFLTDAYERQLALDHFAVKYRKANSWERFDFWGGRGLRFLLRKGNQYLPINHRFYHTDLLSKRWYFIPQITTFSPSFITFIEGYWQSFRYFDGIKNVLKSELQIISPLSAETKQLALEIKKQGSICVHLRMLRNVIKGVDPENISEKNLDYYKTCIVQISKRVKNPKFYCFSDSPEIIQNLLELPFNIQIVSHNKGDERAYEDFYLMQQCEHFILSNSTFGWWAAWLSETQNSIIYTPPSNYWDNQDILPSNWIKI